MSAPSFMDNLTEYCAHMICFVASLNDMGLPGSVLKERIICESKLFGYTLNVPRSGQDKIQLACSKTRYPNCPANVRINCTQNGWVIGAHVFEHNHPPLKDVNVDVFDIHDTLRAFVQAQMNSFQIHTALKTMYPDKVYPLSTISQKVRSLRTEIFGPVGNEYEKLIKHLEEDKDKTVSIFVDRNSLGIVLNFMWADKRAIDIFASTKCDILLIDTTYKVTKFDQSLALLLSMDKHGHYYIVCAAMIALEDANTFQWIFHNLMECCPTFSLSTTVVFTDNDAAMTLAFESFPFVAHYLDLFHFIQCLDRNLRLKMRSYLTFKTRICKLVKSEDSSIVTLELDKLKREHAITTAGRQYIDTYVKPILPKVCVKDRCQYFDLGQSGTNACEAFDRVVNSYGANFNSPALSIIQILDYIFETYTYKNQCLVAKTQSLTKTCDLSPMEKSLKLTLGVYAETKLIKQMRKSISNTLTTLTDNCSFAIVDCTGIAFTVQFDDNASAFKCSCGYFQRKGIPCSHMISVKQKLGKPVTRRAEYIHVPRGADHHHNASNTHKYSPLSPTIAVFA
ncbi:hypothetical protein ROZALSC1DRAFT_24324 [Rozella allomycis CSF55]|uniref:SWIM-type domain-containing protein n=2 Tax=Rozella allomycis (strain CSF55) TaxID=988480 RepID=A0A4P9YDR3_ROZAC|nr:hypothetical protein ROZALSC1DRAFT_24324 [Rozella allomycis CSF55]